MYKFKTIPTWLSDKWDNQIKGYFDYKRKLRPSSNNIDYITGYEAARNNMVLKDEVIHYMGNTHGR